MNKIFYDNFFRMNEIELKQNGDVFESILDSRKNDVDAERFFIKFLPSSEYEKYDFSDRSSLREFRDVCFSIDTPIMPMGGCNLWKRYMDEDMRISGKKISDPYGRVLGSFDIRDGIITYSPLFNHFYNERDVAKFANDQYFTTMTFEDIMRLQIEIANKFLVHTDNYTSSRDLNRFGRYVFEEVSSSEMMDFVNNPELGAMVLSKRKIK